MPNKRIELTESEHALLKEALESYNDMSNDMWLDKVSINLFPHGDQVTTINARQAVVLRNELSDSFDKLANLRTLLGKVGSSVNEKGYSV